MNALPRSLLIFVCVALCVDTSTYATITPLLPDLSDEFGLDKREAGLLAAAYPLGTLLFSLPAAWFASKTSSKLALIAGAALIGLSSLGFGLADNGPLLMSARFLQGIGAAGMWAGALAWLVARTPPERRAEAIGAAVGAAIGGALLGPVLGALAVEAGRAVVFCSFVIAPAALIAYAMRLPAAPPVAALTVGALKTLAKEPRMALGMWLMCFPAVAFGVVTVLVPLDLDRLGAGAGVVAGAFLAATAFEAVMSPVVGRVADRRGRLVPAKVGLGIAAVLFALLIPDSAILITLGLILIAPVLGMNWAPAMALLSEGAEARGIDVSLGFGLANMGWGIGATVGAAGGGALAKATSDLVPYAILAAVALLTVSALRGRAGDAVVAHGAGGV